MPQRATKKDLGVSMGKIIFHGQDAKRIERRLSKIDQTKMKDALSRRGISGIDNRDIAKVMAGEHRSGMSQSMLKNVVEALQEVGVARKAKSASQMVLKASKDAQDTLNPGLTNQAVKARLKNLARERRQEADAVPQEESMSILDRMRGAMGRANKVGSTEPVDETQNEAPANATVRKIRESAREDLKLRPKLVIPKSEDGDFDKTTF
ncbi:hypothetical protein IT407_05160 [Candidatus Uhrbacteria bacterium]|nr:hypothetical protein [Candidatus Uhrbacteria bacterium]